MLGQAFVTPGAAPGLTITPAPTSFAALGSVVASQTSVSGGAAIGVGERQGPAGPGGTDHGFISYGEASAAPSILLAPGARQQLIFSASILNEILATSPFAGQVFWDGASVRPRKAGDTMILRLDLTSQSFVAGGDIEIQIDIGAPFGVIQTVPRALKKAAGVLEMISESFPVYVGSTFLANGGALFLTTSVPTTISMVALLVFPLTAAP